MSPANDPPPHFRNLSALLSDEQTHADPRLSYSSPQTLSDIPVTLSVEEREEVGTMVLLTFTRPPYTNVSYTLRRAQLTYPLV